MIGNSNSADIIQALVTHELQRKKGISVKNYAKVVVVLQYSRIDYVSKPLVCHVKTST